MDKSLFSPPFNEQRGTVKLFCLKVRRTGICWFFMYSEKEVYSLTVNRTVARVIIRDSRRDWVGQFLKIVCPRSS